MYVCMYVCMYVSIYLSIYPSIYLYIYLSIYIYIKRGFDPGRKSGAASIRFTHLWLSVHAPPPRV